MKSFHSNGKLLISGEYLVLDGALSLALPCKYGQSLIFNEESNGTLEWISKDVNDKIWENWEVLNIGQNSSWKDTKD